MSPPVWVGFASCFEPHTTPCRGSGIRPGPPCHDTQRALPVRAVLEYLHPAWLVFTVHSLISFHSSSRLNTFVVVWQDLIACFPEPD